LAPPFLSPSTRCGYVLRLAMRKLPLMALLALLIFSVLPAWPVSANVLTPTDAKALSEIELQALDIGVEMHSALKKTVPTNANANTFDCVFDLDTPLLKFIAALRPLKLLTYLAAQMTDSTDERAVLRMLRNEAEEFLKFREARNGAGALKVIPKCANEALMIVEADKLLRIHDKADAAVRSIIKKITATTTQ
jgi:hypothetical protein